MGRSTTSVRFADDLREDLASAAARMRRNRFNPCLQARRHQACRHPLAGDIAEREHELVRADLLTHEEVAADAARRQRHGSGVVAFNGRHRPRQQQPLRRGRRHQITLEV